MLFLISGNHSIVPAAEGYTPGEHDFTLLAKAVYRSGHDALVLAGNGFEYPNILAAFDAAGWTGIVLGYAGNSGLAPLAVGLTPLAGNGRLEQTAAYPLPEFATNPRSTAAARAFADKYLAKYGEDPRLPAAYAYDNINALAAAATQANSSDPNKIRASFIALRTYVGAVGRYDIKGDGDTEMPLRLWLANGQPAPAPRAPAAIPAPADMQKLPFQSFSTPGQP
jgi:ABC-type branched-subunit amino acid transport system substrate-binding protein